MADIIAREVGYDKISLTNSTKAELDLHKDKLNTYEPVVPESIKAFAEKYKLI